MGDRNENTSAKVIVALTAGVFLLCAVLALVLPRVPQPPSWAWIIFFALVLVGLPPLLRAAERSRIRAAVERQGGRVIWMRRRSSWWQSAWSQFTQGEFAWRGPKYEVEWVDLLGARHRQSCRTSEIHGVEWLPEKKQSG